MTALVVVFHTAITYGSIGSWFYQEIEPSGASSSLLLTFFVLTIQAFFMGFFFLHHNIEALLREQRDVIVFSHAANRHLDVSAADRARNWAEAEPLIVARFHEWEQRGGASGMRRRASDRTAE